MLDVPVYDTVNEANAAQGPIDVSVLFMPAPLVKAAALEAIAAGIKLLVLVPDRVPLYDVLEIAAAAQANDAQFVGPNTLGVLSPGQGVLGMMGGARPHSQWAIPGRWASPAAAADDDQHGLLMALAGSGLDDRPRRW